MLIKIGLNEVEDGLVANIALLLEIPASYLSKVCKFKYQVKVVVIVVVDHLVEFCDVGMVELGPDLDL